MSRRKVSFFLGAGASKALGFPLTSEILPRIRERILDRTLFGRDREALDLLEGFLRKLMPGFGSKDFDPPLITDVLSLIDQMLEVGNVPYAKGSDSDLRECRRVLERAIFRVLDWPYRHRAEAEVPPRLRELVGELVRRTARGDRECVIVSTNYDLAFEREIYRQLGFGEQERGEGLCDVVDFGFSWRDVISGKIHHRPREPRFTLLKLHGSMSWLRCEVCDFIYINPRGSIQHQAFRKEIASQNTCHCGHAPLRAVMVAPSFVRHVRDSNLLSVWRATLEELRTSHEWVVIGYSLPTEDIAIRSLLLRAYQAREEGPPPGIRIVQADGRSESRFRVFFPELDYSSRGLEGFVADGLPGWA